MMVSCSPSHSCLWREWQSRAESRAVSEQQRTAFFSSTLAATLWQRFCRRFDQGMEQQAEVSGRFCIEIPRLHLLQRGVWLGSAPESASSDLTFPTTWQVAVYCMTLNPTSDPTADATFVAIGTPAYLPQTNYRSQACQVMPWRMGRLLHERSC